MKALMIGLHILGNVMFWTGIASAYAFVYDGFRVSEDQGVILFFLTAAGAVIAIASGITLLDISDDRRYR